MAEEAQGEGGMGAADWLRTLAAGVFGGLPGLATSPATQGLWDRGGSALGMEGSQLKSLAGLLFAAATGGGFLPLLSAGWGVAKNFSGPTTPRWWDTPAAPYGANYGRSGPQGLDMGGASYLANPSFSPRYIHPAGNWSKGDVHVGPGSEAALQGLMGGAGDDAFGRLSGKTERLQSRGMQANQVLPSLGIGGGLPRPQNDRFNATRELLGMPLTPDFNAIRAMLGMGG